MENYKICPKCNYKCDSDSNFCENCGCKLDENEFNQPEIKTKTENKSVIAHVFEFVGGLIVFIVILCIFSSSSELKCDNTDVMNLAIDAFKESSLHYRSLSPNQVSRVILENPTEVSHDDSINKYFCKGTIVIKPAQGSGDYRCNVEYTAQQNDDTVYVETSNCNDKYINSKLNKLFDEVQYQVEYSYDE